MQAATRTTLYERLGGFVGITAIVDDFVERLFEQDWIEGRLQGNAHEAKRNLRLLVVDLLCSVSGSPRSPRAGGVSVGHNGLGMTAREWQVTMHHLQAALVHAGLEAADHAAVLQLVAPLEGERRSEPAGDPASLRRAMAPLAVRVAAHAGALHDSFQRAGAAGSS